MLAMWERDTAANETLAAFVERVNADLDRYRAIGLRCNYGTLPDGSIFAQVGRVEIIRHPQTGQAMGESLIDLSVADVKTAQENADRVAAARANRPRILGQQ